MKAPSNIDFSHVARTTTVKDANIKAALFFQDVPRKNGKTCMAYKVWHNGALLFAGNDYHVSPMVREDSKSAIMELLAFMAVQPADVADEYFDRYTPAQLAFASSYDAELLGYAVSRYEEKAH